jgi:16S rRNA (guanine527-N7)-methyltransferase
VFHVKHDRTSRLAESIGLVLPHDALERLDRFEALLRSRAVPLGLVAAADESTIRVRHVEDSLRAAPFVVPGPAADLGSGAGLPGVVVAIVRPDVRVDLVESRRRRLAFLELVVEELGLDNAVPVGARAEARTGPYAAVTARAFADLRRSWETAYPMLAPGGRLIYFAGARFDLSVLGELAAEARAEAVAPPPLLASSGPLVIMGRQ